MESSTHRQREQYLLQWTELKHQTNQPVAPSDFIQFANDYPLANHFPFLGRNPDDRDITVDDGIEPWTHFYANCPGLGVNVPIPLHPKLEETPFYCQLSYLLSVCTRFSHVNGLEALTHEAIDESYLSRGPLVRDIRRALGRGRSILVKGCETRFKGVPIQVPNEAFSGLTLSPHSYLDAQDLPNWSSIVEVSMQEFWEHRLNPRTILNLLDLNGHLDAGLNPWMTALYDDSAARRKVETDMAYSISDLHRFPQWMLYGHPFAHTFTHHDTTGLSTHVTVISGCKLWFLLRWTVNIVTPELWFHRWKNLADGEYLAMEYSTTPPWITGSGERATINREVYANRCDEWEAYRVARWECVELVPGSTLIMPPAQPHLVYKPLMSFAVGGHGLLWESLPLTEIGCRMDNLSADISNDIHPSMPLIHAAMALSLDEDPNDALASGRTQEELCSIVRLMGAPSIYRQARDDKQKLDKRYNKISFARLENAAKKRLVNYQSRFGVEVPDNSTSVPPSISDFSWATFQALA